MSETLTSVLRRHRAGALIAEAEVIRESADGADRTREAERHVREAMLQRVLGNLTAEEECRILSLLHFVMPEHSDVGETPTRDRASGQ